jgi:hypothetical protein
MNDLRTLRTLFTLVLIMAFSCLWVACNEGEKDIPPPGAYLNMPEKGYELEVEDSLLLSPKITYDIDATYFWLLNDVEVSQEKELLHVSKELGKTNYQFVVKTPYGADTLNVLISTIILVDFNEFELAKDSYQLAFGATEENGAIESKGIVFPGYGSSEETWTGFGLSNLYSQSTTSVPGAFSAFAPASAKENFLIYWQPDPPQNAAFSFENASMHKLSSISVSNSTLAYMVMLYGTDDIPRFGDPASANPLDWFLLTIEGFDAQGSKTGEVEFYMADYRFENRKRNYLIKEWSAVDLTPLGLVHEVRMTMTSSLTDENGQILTPPVICIDNIKVIE